MSEKLEITHLNSRGEGIALYQGKEITVPFTLEKEIVEAEIIQSKNSCWGKVLNINTPSDERIEAPCPHYQTCGGCSLQHLSPKAYQAFKKCQVTQPLKKHEIPAHVEDPIIVGPKLRRRVDFMAKKFPERLAMGFSEKNNRRRIDLQKCWVVDPRIEKIFEPLHQMLDQILNLREEVHVFILAAENGVDLLLAGFKRALDEDQKKALVTFAKEQDLTRLTYKVKKRAETLYEKEAPYVTFAGHKIEVHPNVFLQASSKADQTLSQLVCDAVPQNAKRVVDLFCGRGTLSLPLLNESHELYGFEGDKHAISALKNLNLPYLHLEVRDLFAAPLTHDELKQFDTIIMNPPRSGVKEQVLHITEAKVPTVIYVSCNPESFAKDSHELIVNGYKVEKITPVDQFMWSHHIEVVGVFKLDS